jgi:hypothetical protein
MNHLDNPMENNNGKELLHKRFRVSFEIDASYMDVPVHPNDESAFRLLRDHLLRDEESISKLLLWQAVNMLELEFSKLMAKSGFYDSTGSEIVESHARFLPSEAINRLFDLYLDGSGFADEISGFYGHSKLSSVKFMDVDQNKEMLIEPMPEPFFAVKAQDCLLAKNQTEWIAMIQVKINYFSELDIAKSIQKAIDYVDQIHDKVHGSSLPLNYITIGIIAAEKADYEAALAILLKHIQDRLPGIEVKTWHYQKDRVQVGNLTDLFRMQGKK